MVTSSISNLHSTTTSEGVAYICVFISTLTTHVLKVHDLIWLESYNPAHIVTSDHPSHEQQTGSILFD